jgi:hypothetical protein
MSWLLTGLFNALRTSTFNWFESPCRQEQTARQASNTEKSSLILENLQAGFLDYSQDEGDHIDDHSIKDRDQGYLQAAEENARGYQVEKAGDTFSQSVRNLLKRDEHLTDAYHKRKESKYQCKGPDFLNPTGSFPSGEEKGN